VPLSIRGLRPLVILDGGLTTSPSSARLAAQTIRQALCTRRFSATTLQAYERAWRVLLVDELTLRLSIRMLYGWIGDRRMDSILRYILNGHEGFAVYSLRLGLAGHTDIADGTEYFHKCPGITCH
jgi:flavin-dependent dehydrogenase